MIAWASLLGLAAFVSQAATPFTYEPAARMEVVSYARGQVRRLVNRVTFRPRGGTNEPCREYQRLLEGDRLLTGKNSQSLIALTRQSSELLLREMSELEVAPRSSANEATVARLLQGQVVFWSPKKEAPAAIETLIATALHNNTEFLLRAAPDRSVITVFDGSVTLSNAFGIVEVGPGESAEAQRNQAPQKSPTILVQDAVQWWLDYPAVLDPDDLWSRHQPPSAWLGSLAHYRAGDLTAAWEELPPDSEATVDPSCLPYAAGLRLAFGQREAADSLIRVMDRRISPDHPGRRALDRLRRAIRAEPDPPQATELGPPQTASEWLAHSYELQSARQLEAARDAARRAVDLAPRFALAWVRLGELEFSRGYTRAARQAVDQALEWGSRNAGARTLLGFLQLAENRARSARSTFDEAIALDPNHAPAWLGRGLAAIRMGAVDDGKEDLTFAALLEPGRALLRAYLGKVLTQTGDETGGFQELGRAIELDPQDPTGWLYLALLEQRANRVNQAIEDLEASAARNTNRVVYRSGFLLDQDRAVQGVNLANVYADAGLDDFAVREASRAVNLDYANGAAHLFLANSYNALRDPRQVNLRYEAPWLSEFLLANLLSPVGAGTLSQTVSQNEYSKLFERDGLGIVSETLWTSNGDWLESAAQFGHFGSLEYAMDSLYRSEVGQRPNNDLNQLTLSFKAKAQLGFEDTVFLDGIYYDTETGDVAQRYDPSTANPQLRTTEQQEPILLAGWHHEWRPGVHTMLLASPWNARATVLDPAYKAPVGYWRPDGDIRLFESDSLAPLPLDYATRYTGFSAELQQLWQIRTHTLIGGLRYQTGEFDTDATMDVRGLFGSEGEPIREYDAAPNLERFSLYAYDQWQVLPWALVSGGLTFDHLVAPYNFTLPPLTAERSTTDQVSPKIGLTLTPWKGGTLRGAYTRSLGGVSFDQGFRIEPVQVAGFTQTYRGLMPESLVGLVPAQDIQTWGVAVEQRLSSRTYLTLGAEQSESKAEHGLGAFLDPDAFGSGGGYESVTLTQSLDFRERSLVATVNQLAGDYLALGVNYRLSEAELERVLDRVTDGAGYARAVLQRLLLSARFTHPCGLFARWDTTWTAQSNYEAAAQPPSGGPGDNFWQHNVWVGWRFWQRRAELAVGVLNLTDQDYRLHPLNYYPETYRERTFAVSGRFNF